MNIGPYIIEVWVKDHLGAPILKNPDRQEVIKEIGKKNLLMLISLYKDEFFVWDADIDLHYEVAKKLGKDINDYLPVTIEFESKEIFFSGEINPWLNHNETINILDCVQELVIDNSKITGIFGGSVKLNMRERTSFEYRMKRDEDSRIHAHFRK